jgi:hypothetical protein
MIKTLIAFTLSLVISIQAFAFNTFAGSTPYPVKPDPALTPGKLCDKATRLRYPEHIKYCDREVDPETKWYVIKLYVQKYGYNIHPGNRGQFKIDHYIPLCMGGSNDPQNLWPQHEKVYQLTDPMEPLLCEKMSMGRLKQSEAIELIKRGKNDFTQIRAILVYVQRL